MSHYLKLIYVYHVKITSKLIKILFSSLCIFIASFAVSQANDLADSFSAHDNESQVKIDHYLWQEFLTQYVKPSSEGINLVDYKNVDQTNKNNLKSYIQSMQQVNILNYNQNEQMAYWINLYNALTIDVVLDAYPVDSIKEIDSPILKRGPWKGDRLNILGNKLSLDNIEHDILRPIFQDNRVHYGVNCASIGCPNLQTTAFSGDNLDDLLNKGATEYVNHPRGVLVANEKLQVSSIYQWFKEDFGTSDKAIIEHFKLYADDSLTMQLQTVSDIDNDDYDWQLNEY